MKRYIENKESNKYLELMNFKYKDYLKFINNKETNLKWTGVSIQNKIVNQYNMNLKIPLDKAFSFEKQPPSLEDTIMFFFKLICEINDNRNIDWVVKFDNNKYDWLSSKWEGKKKFRKLFNFFITEELPYSFKGGIILNYNLFLELLPELICYPYLLNRGSLNVFNKEDSFIIRITNHLSLDFISNKDSVFLKLIDKLNLKDYDIIQYNNSSVDVSKMVMK